jgi:hypothetical protein
MAQAHIPVQLGRKAFKPLRSQGKFRGDRREMLIALVFSASSAAFLSELRGQRLLAGAISNYGSNVSFPRVRLYSPQPPEAR